MSDNICIENVKPYDDDMYVQVETATHNTAWNIGKNSWYWFLMRHGFLNVTKA